MNDKVLIKVIVPKIAMKYELFIPVCLKVGEVLELVAKAVNDLSGGYYERSESDNLYSKVSGDRYDNNKIVKETDIRNASELILL